MCSSPKSSGGNRPRSAPSKSFAEGLTPQQRARFTEVANRAQQRKDQRLMTNKRWQQTHGNTMSDKTTQAQKSGMFSWLGQIFTSH
ncbi:MAG: hypothetical protein ACJA13_001167 [Paraglaciecola sp.]|jgi:hypothetical protein